MMSLHPDTCAPRMVQVRSKKIIHVHGSGAFALTHKILALPCLWRESLKELSTNCRNSYNGSLQKHQAMHQELSTLRSQIDTRSRVRFVDFDARPVRKEERAELENLVIFGKGLRRRGARSVETGTKNRRLRHFYNMNLVGKTTWIKNCNIPRSRGPKEKLWR